MYPSPPQLTLPLMFQSCSNWEIASERNVRVLEDKSFREDARRIVDTPPPARAQVSSEPVRPAAAPMLTEDMIRCLDANLEHGTPCPSIQSFCAAVLRNIADPVSGKGSLS